MNDNPKIKSGRNRKRLYRIAWEKIREVYESSFKAVQHSNKGKVRKREDRFRRVPARIIIGIIKEWITESNQVQILIKDNRQSQFLKKACYLSN